MPDLPKVLLETEIRAEDTGGCRVSGDGSRTGGSQPRAVQGGRGTFQFCGGGAPWFLEPGAPRARLKRVCKATSPFSLPLSPKLRLSAEDGQLLQG